MSNTKIKNKLIKSFEKIVNQYGFTKIDVLPWYVQELDGMRNILIFTFGKYNGLQFSFINRIHSIEKIWDKYYFTINPTQKNEPYTIYSHLPIIPKYFPEIQSLQELSINFKEENLIENFELEIQSILKNTLIPFFNEVSNLRSLNTIINTPIETYLQVSDLFAGGRDILFKKLIIAQLSKSEKVKDIFDFIHNKYKNEIEKDFEVEHAKLKIRVLNEILNENYFENEI